MIRCVIVDDEPLARKLLEEFIAKTPELSWVGSAQNALTARAMLAKQKVDLIFLDIQMPDLSGIDFLKTMPGRPLVVLTTAFAEYALEGFELDVVDYLLKPFDFNRFLKAVNKISDRIATSKDPTPDPSKPPEYIFVKDGTRLVRVELKSILYIRGSKEYVTFVTPSEKIMSLLSMKALEEQLGEGFIRIHNSYIVRLDAIRSVTKDEVLIASEHLPIGATYKRSFFDKIGSRRR